MMPPFPFAAEIEGQARKGPWELHGLEEVKVVGRASVVDVVEELGPFGFGAVALLPVFRIAKREKG